MESSLEDTTSLTSIYLDRPGHAVHVTFPVSSTDATTFRIPCGSKWSPSAHWHERYTERFRVLKGRVRFIIDGKSWVVAASDGEQTVRKYAVHEFMRADVDVADESKDEGDVVVQEWIDPGTSRELERVNLFHDSLLTRPPHTADGSKEVFFRNLFAIIGEASKFGRYMPLQILYTMNYCDNYEVWLPDSIAWLSKPVTHAMYDVATAIARLLGLKPIYRSYTPQRLHEIAFGARLKTE